LAGIVGPSRPHLDSIVTLGSGSVLEARSVTLLGPGLVDLARRRPRSAGGLAGRLDGLNAPTAAALADWVEARGEWPGPLFVRLDRAAGPGHPTRLDAGNAARASKALGRRAGLARGTNPHGLRHQGITRALDLAGGDVREVKRFSRHATLETLLLYDDNRRDEAGAIAKLLGEDSQ
jgi:hypothetical protein